MARDLINRPDWSGGAVEGYNGRQVADGYDEHWAGGRPVAIPADAFEGLPGQAVEAWQEDPAGAAHRWRTLRDAVSVVGELEEEDREDIVRSFEWLPSNIQAVVLQELAMPPWKRRSASREEVERFTGCDEGFVLAQHWRGKTDQNVGFVLHRIRQIRAKLSGTEWERLERWLNGLTREQMIAVCIALVPTQ